MFALGIYVLLNSFCGYSTVPTLLQLCVCVCVCVCVVFSSLILAHADGVLALTAAAADHVIDFIIHFPI